MTTSSGFVYAATGPVYVSLARRSARALRRVHPDAQIDFFTDVPLDDPVFDRMHALDHVSRRPKMEALRRSRFERTIYLDADTMVVAAIDDVFAVLDHFDIALCAEQKRNDRRVRMQLSGNIVPVAFPQLNSGVMALRRTAQTEAFLTEWHDQVHSRQQKFDQHALRVLLYRSDLRLHILPPEYNVLWFGPFMRLTESYCAPRVLHQPKLHKADPGNPETPFTTDDMLLPGQVEQLQTMLKRDQTLPGFEGPGDDCMPLLPEHDPLPSTPDRKSVLATLGLRAKRTES